MPPHKTSYTKQILHQEFVGDVSELNFEKILLFLIRIFFKLAFLKDNTVKEILIYKLILLTYLQTVLLRLEACA